MHEHTAVAMSSDIWLAPLSASLPKRVIERDTIATSVSNGMRARGREGVMVSFVGMFVCINPPLTQRARWLFFSF